MGRISKEPFYFRSTILVGKLEKRNLPSSVSSRTRETSSYMSTSSANIRFPKVRRRKTKPNKRKQYHAARPDPRPRNQCSPAAKQHSFDESPGVFVRFGRSYIASRQHLLFCSSLLGEKPSSFKGATVHSGVVSCPLRGVRFLRRDAT